MGDPTVRTVPAPQRAAYHLPPADLPSVGKEVIVHRDKLADVAKVLRGDHDLLAGRGDGSLDSFQVTVGHDPKGLVTQIELGDYPASNGLEQTCKNAYDHISSVYSSFLDAYDGFINSLDQTAKNYNNAEDATQAHARTSGGTNTSNAPTAG
jgi:hypothetical protein